MNTGLRRAGIVGLSTVVAASMMTLTAATAQADWATSGGDIGLVDTCTMAAPTTACPVVAGTQGATLVYPNVAGQALGSMRLLVPNSFKSGDTIDLTIFDRTATNATSGDINANLEHRVSFSSVPTVAVYPVGVSAATNVGPLSSDANNTEGIGANVPSPVTAAAATTAPIFTTTLVSSSRADGLNPKAKDIVRLTIGNLSAGTDLTAKWRVTVSGVTADLGPSVSPGELRVVPFAYNGTPGAVGTLPSEMFAGNLPDPVETPGPQIYNPVINLYTVPAYVSPVNFGVGAPSSIVADGTDQSVGAITIAETNGYSLQDGTYTVTVAGAAIANTAGSPVVVAATGLGTGETITTPAVVNTPPGTLKFTLAGATTSKLSITLSGLLLNDTTKGPVTYTLSGGSINQFLATPAGSSPAIGTPPNGVLADAFFGTPNGASTAVNQNDIEAAALPTVDATSTPIAFRIGGIDRYDTAAKIALYNGENDVAVLASGMDFPDALSSGYLASKFGASILLTKQNSLPASTLQALRENGVLTVYVIGQTGAISAGVEAQLRATPQYYPGGDATNGQGKLQVIRLGGIDRYATNKVVNLRAAALTFHGNPVGRTQITYGQASKLTALVATGFDFADAMAGGPATSGSGSGSLPLILTRPGLLSPTASSQMTSLGIEQAVILGGTGAVSATVATSIEALGASTYRIGGANRFETATMIGDFEMALTIPTATVKGGLGFTGNHAYLATGLDFADALAGAPLAGGSETPIVLTHPTTLSSETSKWLTTNAADFDYVTAFGLGGAVSTAVLNAANTAIAGG